MWEKAQKCYVGDWLKNCECSQILLMLALALVELTSVALLFKLIFFTVYLRNIRWIEKLNDLHGYTKISEQRHPSVGKQYPILLQIPFFFSRGEAINFMIFVYIFELLVIKF